MLWLWIVGGLVVWLVLATLLAVVIGRGIRLGERGTAASYPTLTTADLPPTFVAAAPPAARRARRRAVPLPPVGIVLAGLAVGLMTTGYALRLAGATGPAAQLLSMDAASSLPRLFVAGLFAAAALAAVAGAGRIPGRRTWWLAVALIAGGIAAVKAGGSVHNRALNALEGAVGYPVATVASALAAIAVVGSLWFLSRHERRDRRRVVGTLALYAGASVALSAVSSVAGDWRVTATFLEESGEALAGVAFLMAVLVGVAPRLVLPADWAMRRSGDAHTLDLPELLPGRGVDGTTQA
ncbi:hypothetical protein [Blastococcus capsensis]|uniref:hypothetical protein n=1 Tax=Blastococcus capsensis TaxID=1564163 RepID=UPI002540CCF2|nr:hypothetical protein [Blastococcus capsensis]MDK3257105.1 hypothetical protein [Blastococcus capsensis]